MLSRKFLTNAILSMMCVACSYSPSSGLLGLVPSTSERAEASEPLLSREEKDVKIGINSSLLVYVKGFFPEHGNFEANIHGDEDDPKTFKVYEQQSYDPNTKIMFIEGGKIKKGNLVDLIGKDLTVFKLGTVTYLKLSCPKSGMVSVCPVPASIEYVLEKAGSDEVEKENRGDTYSKYAVCAEILCALYVSYYNPEKDAYKVSVLLRLEGGNVPVYDGRDGGRNKEIIEKALESLRRQQRGGFFQRVVGGLSRSSKS